MLVAACGGDDSGSHGAVPLADFGTRIGTQYCGKAFECCTTEELPQLFIGADFTDEPGCIDFYTRFFGFLTPMYQASIDAGKMTYDAEHAADCVAAAGGLTCTQFAVHESALGGMCESPFIGLVANDAECAFDEECVSGYCDGDSIAPVKTGLCKTLPAAGEACPSLDCAEGSQCQSGTCMPLKADGASCRNRDECASGACNGASTQTAGTCGAPMICNGL